MSVKTTPSKANKITEKFSFVRPMLPPEIETVGRKKEIALALDTLYKSRLRNLLVIGPAGIGKTHLVREVATRVKDQYVFYEVSITSMVAGMKYVGDLEKRFADLFNCAVIEQNLFGYRIVLFIDEIHAVIGAGSNKGERYELDIAQMLKPRLSECQVAVWGATTSEEFEAAIVPDRALRRRFDVLELGALEKDDVLIALRRFSQGTVPDEVLRQIILEAGEGLPDSAIERLDLLLAHKKRIEALGLLEDEDPTTILDGWNARKTRPIEKILKEGDARFQGRGHAVNIINRPKRQEQ